MKKFILIISIGLWCLTFNLNAQTKTDKPTLANSNKITQVDNKNITIKSQLQTASKTSTNIQEKKESNSKNNNTSNLPKIEVMSKKEEK